MFLELKQGLQALANGASGFFRGDKTGALVIAQGHGAYTEAALQGTIMEACNAVAGIAPGTVLAVAPPLALWNPPSSGKNLSVLKAAMGYISGTLGAGSIFLAQVNAQTTVPTGGTELVPVCSNLALPRGIGRVFAGSTFVSVPTPIRPLFSIGAFAGGAQVPVDTVDVLDGSIIVPPGSALVLQGVAGAGTSPLVNFAFTWEEIPL